jgi:hypothetical protein
MGKKGAKGRSSRNIDKVEVNAITCMVSFFFLPFAVKKISLLFQFIIFWGKFSIHILK